MLALVSCCWENADGMLHSGQDCIAVAVIPATTTTTTVLSYYTDSYTLSVLLFCYWCA